MKTLLLAAVLAIAAPAAAANLGIVDFSGTVLTRNGVPATPGADNRVLGSVTFSDGSDPGGPPAVPSGYTGLVRFGDLPGEDSGDADFHWGVAGAFSGRLMDMNPYHEAQVDLVRGRIVGVYLYTDGDGDTFTLIGGSLGGSFDHALFDGGDDGGTWRLDVASRTPEPGAWLLMIDGFGLTSLMLRRRAVAAGA